MKFGVNMVGVRADAVTGFARTAEELGFESLFVPDHLIFPETVTARYPYTADGSFPFPTNIPLVDPWVQLAHAAAVTSTINLGTAVYVLPLRNILVTARAVVSLDVLSGGRAILGAGLGWLSDEFVAAGQDFATRGRRAEEMVEALRRLWSDDTPEFHGDHVDFGRVRFEPKPHGGRRLPIVLGGDSDVAVRRAARIADGWMSGALDVEGVARAVRLARDQRAEADVADPFEVSAIHNGPLSPELVERYAEAGVVRLIVTAWTRTSEVVPAMERLSTELIARFT